MSANNGALRLVIVLVLIFCLDGAVHASVPGIGRIIAATRKAFGATVGKSAVKAVTRSAGTRMTRQTVTKMLADSAPRSLVEKVTPGQILAAGGAAGIVITAGGAAHAMHEIASPTGMAMAKAIDGTASSSGRVIGEIRGFLDGIAENILFYISLFFFCAAFTLFWRFGLMPWHRKTDTPASAPAFHAAPDISDAEVVGAQRPERH